VNRRHRWICKAVLTAAPLACAPTSDGYPPPCGPEVTRSDCHVGRRVALRCDPEAWLRAAVERAGPGLTECSEALGTYVGTVTGRARASATQLHRFYESADLFSIEGISSARLAHCCEHGAPSGVCLALELERCRTAPDALLPRLAALADENGDLRGKSFDVAITVVGLKSPRCSPEDPECRPLPYSADSPPSYHPNASRHVFPDLPERVLEGECAHDGDCYVTGCGNRCSSWIWRNYPSTCQGRPELRDSFCGCVAGRCRWFDQ
jgi:hypothetical protein